jgi:hypothetical protein
MSVGSSTVLSSTTILVIVVDLVVAFWVLDTWFSVSLTIFANSEQFVLEYRCSASDVLSAPDLRSQYVEELQ